MSDAAMETTAPPATAGPDPLVPGQRHILEMIATRAPLDDTLAALTQYVESLEPGTRCGLLVLSQDGNRFQCFSGASIPDPYHRARMDGSTASSHAGPCGLAVYSGAAVSVPDIAQDPRWAPGWRDLALARGFRACRSTPVRVADGTVVASLALYYGNAGEPRPVQPGLVDMAIHLAGIVLDGERRHAAQRRAHALATSQQQALEMAMRDASLGGILELLAGAARDQWDGAKASLFMIDPAGDCLRFGAAAGLDASYGTTVDGFPIGRDSPACGLAAHTGEVVVTADVTRDPRWAPYLELAQTHGFRACWSYPIRNAGGEMLGTIAIYHEHPREPRAGELDPLKLLAGTAALVMERHRILAENRLARDTLRETQAREMRELIATRRLQQISTRLIEEDDVGALYRHLLDAAVAIMESDAASVQVLDDERGELLLLASRGFHPDSAAFWQWVGVESGSTCGEALRTGKRVVVEDLQACAFVAGTDDLQSYRWSQLRAVQTTPLISRTGRPLGMISTHWRTPHRPSSHELRLLDVLARQAAELIERRQAEESLQRESRAARAAEAHGELLLHELSHRVKNTLATVQSIAIQTLRHAHTHEAFETVFLARLTALAHTHDLLMRSNWRGAALGELLLLELGPYGSPGSERWSLAGEDVRLSSKTALALGMALHELATNAAKYGALSSASGRVEVAWQVEPTPAGDALHLRWQEHEGPPVVQPQRRGFGSRLIERGLAYELQAEVSLGFPPQGACCTLRIPLTAEPEQPLNPHG